MAFSHDVDAQTESCIKGVSLEVFTRRGNSLGTLTLPIALQWVRPTSIPYKLLAMEPGQPHSILLIDLKPLQIRRVALESMPVYIAVATWGYVLMAVDGRITLLNPYGEIVGHIAGPQHPSAIALAAPFTLLVATWHKARGILHTIDLRSLNLDLVF
jgi:serine/threonine-protein kinase